MAPKKGEQRRNVAPFVKKLSDALRNYPDLLSWKPDGKHFRILNEHRLVEVVFNNIALASFHRNLNLYNFVKHGDVVHHKDYLFSRGQTEESLKDIHVGTKKTPPPPVQLLPDMMSPQPSPAPLAIQARPVAPAGFTLPIQDYSFQGSGQQPQGAPLAVVLPQKMQSTSTHGGFQPTQEYQRQSVATLMDGTQPPQLHHHHQQLGSSPENASMQSVASFSQPIASAVELNNEHTFFRSANEAQLQQSTSLPQLSQQDLRQSNADAPTYQINCLTSSDFSDQESDYISEVIGCASQSARQVRLLQWDDVTIMNPMCGPKQGGTSFKIRLSSSFVEFEYLLATFVGIPGSKKVVHCEGNIWLGLTPKGNEPGPVTVVFKTPNGFEIGTACFTYYDDHNPCSTDQRPFNSGMDEHQGNSGAGAGNNSDNSSAFDELFFPCTELCLDLSSYDSDTDSDEELKRAVFKDSKRGDEKEQQVPNHLLKSKLCGDESDEPDDLLSELTKLSQLSLEDGKELHEAFSEAKQEGKWKQDSQGEEKEQTERTNFPKSDKSGEPVVPELTTLSLEDGQDPTGISIHHVSGKEEEKLREGEILRPVDTGDDMPSTFSEKKTDDSEDRSQAEFGQDKTEILPECKIPGKNRIYDGEGDEASVFLSELHGTASEKKGSEEWIQGSPPQKEPRTSVLPRDTAADQPESATMESEGGS